MRGVGVAVSVLAGDKRGTSVLSVLSCQSDIGRGSLQAQPFCHYCLCGRMLCLMLERDATDYLA